MNLTKLQREYLDEHAIPHPKKPLDPKEIAEAKKIWARQHPGKSEEEIEAHAIGHVAWANRELPQQELQNVQIRVEHPRAELRWIIGLLAAILFLLLSSKAHAQVDCVKFLAADTTTIRANYCAPFKIIEGTGMVFSKDGSGRLVMTPTGGVALAGGSNTQVQWNNATALGGISTFTTDGTINTAKVGTNWLFVDPTDTSKKIQFDASGITTATTRTIAFPDANSRTIKNGSTTGQIPIWNAATSTFDVSDPLVQGTTAEGAAIPNPVVIAGKDGSGNNKALVLDASGRPTVNVNGTVAVSLASAPTTAVTIADAADTTLGAKADAKSSATDTTSISVMSVLKQISASVQAPPSQAVTNAGTFAVQIAANSSVNQAQVGGTAIVADPCQSTAKLYDSFSGTANTQLITGTSAKKIYFCSFSILVGAATNVAIVSGTGTVCATGITKFLSGGTTAATGWNFAANGGLVIGNGTGAIGAEGNNADNVCVLVSAANQTNINYSYVVQ